MKAILFDLDGTLLPMDMETFTEGYFSLLAKKAAPRGYAAKELVAGIWKGTKAMVQNDGAMSNQDRFWAAFAGVFGDRVYSDTALFDDFYANEFDGAVHFTQPAPEKAQRAVQAARRVAERVILATNPIFPAVGVATRLGWIGLNPGDFDYITTYENASYCKPNPKYYEQILCLNGLDPADCLMIGNDVGEDIIPAAAIDMKALLVRDCVINTRGLTHTAPSCAFSELPEQFELAYESASQF